jgi:hypothetical protein
VCDLSYLLRPRTYPEAFRLVYDSFASQPNPLTCGAAALRHGLLLGGLLAPVTLLESLLEIRNNWETHYTTLLDALCRLGFQTEPEPRVRPEGQSTADFLAALGSELEQGTVAFLLPCLNYAGGHWVCLGAWDGMRAWLVDSYTNDPPHFHFLGYTAQEFYEDALDDDDGNLYVNVVRPGSIWADHYRAWLPARRALMRMPVQDNPASMEAVVRIAAHQYLDDAEYSYRELGLYLPDGVEVTVKVKDPGKDAVLVAEERVGEDRVLVVRRASGMLTRQPPPELVLRAGQLLATHLR